MNTQEPLSVTQKAEQYRTKQRTDDNITYILVAILALMLGGLAAYAWYEYSKGKEQNILWLALGSTAIALTLLAVIIWRFIDRKDRAKRVEQTISSMYPQ